MKPIPHPERLSLHTRRSDGWTPGKGAFIAAAVAVAVLIIVRVI